MRCERYRQMMSEQLDGGLSAGEQGKLNAHLEECDTCQAAWERMRAVDQLFRGAAMVEAPVRLRVDVMERLGGETRRRNLVWGGIGLALGSGVVTALLILPVLLGVLNASGVASTLVSGGPETAAQLLTVARSAGRVAWTLLETFGLPLVAAGFCTMVMALVINGIWLGTLHRLRVVR